MLAIAIIAIGIIFVVMPAFAQKKDSFDNGLKALNDIWQKKGIDPITEPIIDGDATNQLTVEDLQAIQKQLQNFDVSGYENSGQLSAIKDSYLSLVNIMVLEDDISRLEAGLSYSENGCPSDKTSFEKQYSDYLKIFEEVKKLSANIQKTGSQDYIFSEEIDYLNGILLDESTIKGVYSDLKANC